MFTNTDAEWEKFGAENPYYGVVSFDEFNRDQMSPEAKARFFASGETYVQATVDYIEQRLGVPFQPKRVLDFGCGVARLTIPFARRAEAAVGVDVSPSMLAEAAKNCAELGVTNCQFIPSDDQLSRLEGEYDCIHSYIVFQHIPVARGMQLMRKLYQHLAVGGIGIIHFTAYPRSPMKWLVDTAKGKLPFGVQIANLLKGRPFNAPTMQMNPYDLNAVLAETMKLNPGLILLEPTQHDYDGYVMYFQRQPERAPNR